MRVSICTPTFNRRPFFASLIACVAEQTYDHAWIEWIIADDGTDPIEDLVSEIPYVKYIKLEREEDGSPMPLGEKRALMHSYCTGDVIVNMDDDDYYPPSRVAHAVTELVAGRKATGALIAGCSELHVVSPAGMLYQFGPYRDNHATAATFAYFRELLDTTAYRADDVVGEEKAFLQGYTLPVTPLDPRLTILVFMHPHNTINRQVLVDAGDRARVAPSPLSIADFFDVPATRERVVAFYANELPHLLAAYRPGEPARKKYVHLITQLKERVFTLEAAHAQLAVENTVLRRQLQDKQDIIQRLFAKLKTT